MSAYHVLARKPPARLTFAERQALLHGGLWPFRRRAAWEAAWASAGPDLVADLIARHPGQRPQAWWELTPGIPAALRRPLPEPEPAAVLSVLTSDDRPLRAAKLERAAAEAARLRHLWQAGHLEPDELDAIAKAAGPAWAILAPLVEPPAA